MELESLMFPNFRIVLVGNPGIGKNRALISLTTGTYPTGFTNDKGGYRHSKVIDDVYRKCTFYTKNSKIIKVGYLATDCFVFCYDVNNRESLIDLKNRFYPSISKYANKNCVLLGFKNEKKDSYSVEVSDEDVEDVAEEIKTVKNLEFSPMNKWETDDTFDEIIRIAAQSTQN
eukprot:TRINITY_DN3237_c1_g1_i1.p1 TRINITY_DN3237_c1_g1~~TRINITY_DN3237_c1_g1_i1.p1  ORF type:complete len:173 (-),score=27.83 TRINITY_DN3237_c1_g1_i1:84-602(-)